MIYTSNAFQSELQNTTGRTIRSKIELYDTKMAVPSKGLKFIMYPWSGTGTPSFSGDQLLPATGGEYGVVPNLSLAWPYSSPFFINTDNFAVEFSGYFQAEETSSDFGFYVFGDNIHVTLVFDSATHISDEIVYHNGTFGNSSSADSVTSGNWYTFSVKIWGGNGYRHGGVSVQYTYNLSSIDEGNFRYFTNGDPTDLKILNAGVCSPDSSFLSAVQVSNFDKIRGERADNEVSTYSFSLPYGTGGYAKSGNTYTNGTASLEEGKLIKIYAGYDCAITPVASETEGDVSGDVEYIPRFSGFIYGFDVDRESNVLTVNCRDFFSRAEETLCINTPSTVSYWSADYMLTRVWGEPDGREVPIAYDRWNVVSTIKDLLMNAGIPASLFYGYEKNRDSGDDLQDTVTSMYDGGFLLDSARYYGTDSAEEYLNVFDAGTTIHEAVMKVVDTYGYGVEFKPNGNLHFYPRNNPTAEEGDSAVIGDENASMSGSSPTDWEAMTGDARALGGRYLDVKTLNTTMTFSNIAGTGFTLIVKRNTNSGLDNNDNLYWQGTASVKIEVKINGGSVVSTYNYNFYFEEERYYLDGVSPLVGANPCVINLDRNLSYDNYDIIITNLNSSYDISIDELWVYYSNSLTSSKELRTFKTAGSIGSINRINFERGIEDVRNDVLVVGQRRGIWVATGGQEVGIDDPEFSERNNNQYTNYHSRTVDSESIYNPSATNYMGRHLMTYIQEPNINTYDRAKWLSYNVLNNYREIKNNVDFSLIGDPEIYIGDPISIVDKLEDDGTNDYWVKSIDEEITKADWRIAVDVNGNSPYPSYSLNSNYDIGLFNDEFFDGLSIVDNNGYSRNGSLSTTVSGTHSWTATSITVADNVDSWDDAVAVVVYHSNSPFYGVFITTATSGTTLTGSFAASVGGYVTPQGYTGGTYQFVTGWKVANIYNPYEESDYGGFINVSLTCLVEGSIRLGIKSQHRGVPRYIAGLTDGGGLTVGDEPKEQYVTPGDVLNLIWGGVDEDGATHIVSSDNTNIGPGFYAEDEGYYIEFSYTQFETGIVNTTSSEGVSTGGSGASGSPQTISLAKSGVDHHELSYTTPTRSGGNRNISSYPAYSYEPGGDGGIVDGANSSALYDNINYIWTRNDGYINLNFRSHYIDTPRSYWIEYDTERVESHMEYIDIPLGDGPKWSNENAQISHYKLVTKQKLNDGNPVQWRFGDSYNVRLDPDESIWGYAAVDSRYANYKSGAAPLATYVLELAIQFWFRLIMHITDASGRIVRFINNSSSFQKRNQEIRRSLIHGDNINMVYYAYSNANWTTAFEIMMIPMVIDSDEANHSFRDINVHWHAPGFEALDDRQPWCHYDNRGN